MARTTITSYDEYTRETIVEGWYDPDRTVEAIDEATRWDGHNRVGVISGIPMGSRYTLYRTAGGRWVERADRSGYFDGRDTSRFLTDEQARDWLLRSSDAEGAEAALSRYWSLDDEEAPRNVGGRPEIGPAISIKVPTDILARIDAAATEAGSSRAEWIRQACAAALAAGIEGCEPAEGEPE